MIVTYLKHTEHTFINSNGTILLERNLMVNWKLLKTDPVFEVGGYTTLSTWQLQLPRHSHQTGQPALTITVILGGSAPSVQML